MSAAGEEDPVQSGSSRSRRRGWRVQLGMERNGAFKGEWLKPRFPFSVRKQSLRWGCKGLSEGTLSGEALKE